MRSDDGNREEWPPGGRKGRQEPLGTEMGGPAAQGRVQPLTPPPGAACSLLSLQPSCQQEQLPRRRGRLPAPPPSGTAGPPSPGRLRHPALGPVGVSVLPSRQAPPSHPSWGLAALSPSGLRWVAEGHVVGATGWWWSPQEMPRPRG